MKLTFEFTPEEKARLEKIENIDICEGIDCFSFVGCAGCPLKRAAELKDKLDEVLRKVRGEV